MSKIKVSELPESEGFSEGQYLYVIDADGKSKKIMIDDILPEDGSEDRPFSVGPFVDWGASYYVKLDSNKTFTFAHDAMISKKNLRLLVDDVEVQDGIVDASGRDIYVQRGTVITNPSGSTNSYPVYFLKGANIDYELAEDQGMTIIKSVNGKDFNDFCNSPTGAWPFVNPDTGIYASNDITNKTTIDVDDEENVAKLRKIGQDDLNTAFKAYYIRLKPDSDISSKQFYVSLNVKGPSGLGVVSSYKKAKQLFYTSGSASATQNRYFRVAYKNKPYVKSIQMKINLLAIKLFDNT